MPTESVRADNRVRNWTDLRIIKDRGFFGVTKPVMFRLYDTTAQTAANWTAPFFIADRPYVLLAVKERHETAATNADTVQLNKVPSGTVPASGSAMLSTGILLNGTANTNVSGSLTTTKANLSLATGDALSFITTGTLAALKGVTISIILRAV